MNNESEMKFKIDKDIINNYIVAVNSIELPISKIKKYLNQFQDSKRSTKIIGNLEEHLENINIMSNLIKKLLTKFPKEKSRIFIDTIHQIMNLNKGILSVKMIEPLNISRQYLSIMEKNNEIEYVSRGIYILTDTFEDSYFLFQLRYKKVIFSHMNALYFYGLTEEFPYNYTVTVPKNYHVDMVNEKCNVFYVDDEIYEMGIVEVETPNGNKVRAYNKERSICDIIRSKGRMDPEQIKKSIKQYIKSNDKDLARLSNYAKKMGISEKVMEVLGAYYE